MNNQINPNKKITRIIYGIAILTVIICTIIFNATGQYRSTRRLYLNQYIGTNGFARVMARITDIENDQRLGRDVCVLELDKLRRITPENIQTEIVNVNVKISNDQGAITINYVMHIPELRRVYIGATTPSRRRRGEESPFVSNYSFSLTVNDKVYYGGVLMWGNSEILRRAFNVYIIRDVDIYSLSSAGVELTLHMYGRAFSIPLISRYGGIAS